MKKLKGIIFVAIVIAMAIGVFTLINWDIPAPSEKVERILPDDDFPR